MRQFKLQDSEAFDEDGLVARIHARSGRFINLRDHDSPDIIVENERDLMDKACGEWVSRRGGRIVYAMSPEQDMLGGG